MSNRITPEAALRIIYTWADHDAKAGERQALDPLHVRRLCERALAQADKGGDRQSK
jgi:hypothetical protein